MTKLLTSVKDLRVLITGGNSGLGAATARYLLERGARVLILDKTEAASPPDKAIYCQGDVTDEAQVSATMATALEKLGGLDAAVNCAGIAFAARTYNWNRDTVSSLEEFRMLLTVNTLGTFNVCRLAAQLMAKNGPPIAKDAKEGSSVSRGVLVNTSSLSAFDGQSSQVQYSASKAAVAAMTLPLARDLAPLGIRVCTIAPGYFDSPMSCRENFPPRVKKFLADHNRAIYRLGRPDEFASTVEAIMLNPMLNGTPMRLDAASRGFFYQPLKTRRSTAASLEKPSTNKGASQTAFSATLEADQIAA